MNFRALIFWMLVLTGAGARAQSVSATLDSTRILVGSPATLRLELTAQAGWAVQWAQVPDTFGGGLEVLSRGRIDTVRRGGAVVYVQSVQITGFDSGLFEVPAIAFLYTGGVLQTPSIPLLVQTLPVDTTKPFRPIKDIIEGPRSAWDYWPYALVGVLLLAALLWILLRRKAPRVPKPKTLESPAVVALRALAELEKSGLLERGAMGEAFTRASDILRRYLEGRFGIVALEEPTDGMLRSIGNRPELKVHHGVLREFFLTADLAKFAKATPTLTQAHEALGQARAFIHTSANTIKTR